MAGSKWRMIVALSNMMLLLLLNVHHSTNLHDYAPRWAVYDVEQQQQFHQTTQSSATATTKVLVVLIGGLRCGERAWHSLYEHVLNTPNNKTVAELALLVGDPPARYQNASLLERAKYVWTFPEYSNWNDAVQNAVDQHVRLDNNLLQQYNLPIFTAQQAATWKNRTIPLINKNSVILAGTGNSLSGAINYIIRWFLILRLLQNDAALLQTYDAFVVTRADHYYLCRQPDNVMSKMSHDRSIIYVPEGEDYGGMNDRHIVVSRSHVLKVLNVLPAIVQHPDRYASALADKDTNPEKLMVRRWREQGIVVNGEPPSATAGQPVVQRIPRTMFTCGLPGDSTRWKPYSRSLAEREHVQWKYVKEYKAGYATCGLQFSNPPADTGRAEALKLTNMRQRTHVFTHFCVFLGLFYICKSWYNRTRCQPETRS